MRAKTLNQIAQEAAKYSVETLDDEKTARLIAALWNEEVTA